ncbi:MAG: glucose-6-phosphate isomerase [Brevundimonas sp.]|uniref:glucose-6-phosphate isomerase n=1 Tax=Brevundimonas sp. TaxID=1871086 RepID=UPI00391AAA77
MVSGHDKDQGRTAHAIGEASGDALGTALLQGDRARTISAHFADEPDRMARLTLEAAGLFIDLSKQAFSLDQLDRLLKLAEAADVPGWRARMFAGEAVNASEQRAVLHPALRAEDDADFSALGKPVMDEVRAQRRAMQALAEAIGAGERRGAGGAAFRAIVHIGIGGSDLGPRLVWEALRPRAPGMDLRFVANIDPDELDEALSGLDPASTLVVVVSKTFTTRETLFNAERARRWLAAALGESEARSHLIGVSAAPERARAFGCGEVIGFADWVGGRFSLWSGVGLSCAIALGWPTFSRLLDGARAMDAHFLSAPLGASAPVLMALAEVWNVNALGRHARSVAPYAHRLRRLPAYLQQLEMESNGKSVGRMGQRLDHHTAPVVFGEPGTNGQHAFFQMLHQGTSVVPVDIIAVRESVEQTGDRRPLNANAIAQGEALMLGRSEAEVRQRLEAEGRSPAEIDALAPQMAFAGDRPATTIVLDALTPERLGELIALFEHKVFVLGVIWGVNSFDQWGVELGKVLARTLEAALERPQDAAGHDPSTLSLIARLTQAPQS